MESPLSGESGSFRDARCEKLMWNACNDMSWNILLHWSTSNRICPSSVYFLACCMCFREVWPSSSGGFLNCCTGCWLIWSLNSLRFTKTSESALAGKATTKIIKLLSTLFWLVLCSSSCFYSTHFTLLPSSCFSLLTYPLSPVSWPISSW